MGQKISVVIITLNESSNIERCIKSCQKISNDIVVVDANSTDDTVRIAKSLGARVFSKEWIGYGQNKNYGNDQAINDWILSIDADETLDDELISSINQSDLITNTIYRMINQLNYCGHWVRFTDWHPSYKKRLFNKQHTKWDTLDVHEGLIINDNTNLISLKGKMLHYGYTSYQQLIDKTTHYAKLSASKMFKIKKQPNLLKLLFGPSFRFVKSYFIQLGILDGKAGYEISIMNAKLISLRHQYLKELQSKE